jgi:hypothetical protein
MAALRIGYESVKPGAVQWLFCRRPGLFVNQSLAQYLSVVRFVGVFFERLER